MVDHLPVDVPARPRPRLHTLTLLVGRVTTIKLAYWAALTGFELALPRLTDRGVGERLPISVAVFAALSILACAWAVTSARSIDRRSGGITRSAATIATTFAAASVVASPASLPLLLIERQRSIEGCVGTQACHLEAIALWIAMFAVGMLLIPLCFAFALRRAERPG